MGKFYKICGLFLLTPLLVLFSCLSIHIAKGRAAEIIAKEIDFNLNDSTLIYGTAVLVESGNMPATGASIWIEDTGLSTTTDKYGKFSLTIQPGTYTVNCLQPGSDERLLSTLENIQTKPNERIEVNFYHGVLSE